MQAIIFDIETVPNERAEKWVQSQDFPPDPKLNPIDQPPASITGIKTDALREERLKEWKDEQARKLDASIMARRQKAYDDAGLRWWTGKIICISATVGGERYDFYGDDERELLSKFCTLLVSLPNHAVCGKQSDDFDIPFLKGRLIAHNLGMPSQLLPDFGRSQQWDVNHIFHRSHYCQQRGKLDDYAWGMAIDGKTGKGNEVLSKYQQAILGDQTKWTEIVEYCRRDVAITVEMFARATKRFEKQVVEMNINEIPF